jgi:hypothetical protein
VSEIPKNSQVYGTLTITSAASEQNLTHYHLYYGGSVKIPNQKWSSSAESIGHFG